MRAPLVATALAIAVAANAQPLDLGLHTTVGEFAQACERPVDKTHTQMRARVCAAYVSAAAAQIGATVRKPECWRQLEEDSYPGVLEPLLFHLATDPVERNRGVADALRDLITTVTAKACR